MAKESLKKSIAALKARLQQKEALLNTSNRKERNGQLIAWGVFVETLYKKGDNRVNRSLLQEMANELFATDERNLNRAKQGFERLNEEIAAQKKTKKKAKQ